MKKNVLAMILSVCLVITFVILVVLLAPSPAEVPETEETAPQSSDYSNYGGPSLIEYKMLDESVGEAKLINKIKPKL